MAKLPSAFDSSKHEPNDFEAIPAGKYIGRIIESKMKDCSATAKDPDGKYLSLTFKLDPGQDYAGRRLFHNLNLINKNETAVSIAQGDLSAITQAVGKKIIQDSEELHGTPILLTVAQEPDGRGPDFPPRNAIKKFEPVDGAKKATGAAKKEGGKKKAPWED